MSAWLSALGLALVGWSGPAPPPSSELRAEFVDYRRTWDVDVDNAIEYRVKDRQGRPVAGVRVRLCAVDINTEELDEAEDRNLDPAPSSESDALGRGSIDVPRRGAGSTAAPGSMRPGYSYALCAAGPPTTVISDKVIEGAAEKRTTNFPHAGHPLGDEVDPRPRLDGAHVRLLPRSATGKACGEGRGFFINDRGWVVTAHHVPQQCVGLTHVDVSFSVSALRGGKLPPEYAERLDAQCRQGRCTVRYETYRQRLKRLDPTDNPLRDKDKDKGFGPDHEDWYSLTLLVPLRDDASVPELAVETFLAVADPKGYRMNGLGDLHRYDEDVRVLDPVGITSPVGLYIGPCKKPASPYSCGRRTGFADPYITIGGNGLGCGWSGTPLLDDYSSVWAVYMGKSGGPDHCGNATGQPTAHPAPDIEVMLDSLEARLLKTKARPTASNTSPPNPGSN